jgi:MraZ protein
LIAIGAYIYQGFDQNLIVMANEPYEQIYQQLNQMNMTDPIARQLKRHILSNTDWVEVDKAGRILIPQFLRQSAQIDGTAIVVGVGDYFEIWSPNNWAKQNELIQDVDTNLQKYASYNISIR